jgi:ATP-dependent DNA ligase
MKFGLYSDMGHETMEEILDDPYKNINQLKPIFMVFDMIKLGEYSFLNQKLSHRRREAFKVVNYIRQMGVDNVTTIAEKPSTQTKEEYYNYIIGKGGEGVIAKNINDAYDSRGSRGNSWIKIKRRRYEGYSNLNSETYDLFISNATILNNIVNGLVLSSYVVDKANNYIYDKFGNRQSKVMGILYDLRPELKSMLTSYVNNKPTLNTIYLNRVVEVSSSGFNSDTQKLNNLSFICWRVDKTHESCTIQAEDIS